MKRAKRIISILAAVSLTLSAAVVTLADDAVSYGDLKHSMKPFIVGTTLVDVGDYPQIDGMDALNKKIVNDLNDTYQSNFVASDVNAFGRLKVETNITDDHGVYSKIEITVTYDSKNSLSSDNTITITYYIDKSNYSEVDKDAYEEGIAEPEEDEAEEAAEDEAVAEDEETAVEETSEEAVAEDAITVVPLRKYAEQLGYELTWNPELSLIEVVKDGEVVVQIVVDKDAYTVNGNDIKLGVAPTLVDGVTYVPATFFSEILGADVVIDAAGNVEITMPAA